MIGMQYYLRRQDTVARIFFASAAVLKLPASVAARGENERDEHNRAPLAQQKKFRIGGGSRVRRRAAVAAVLTSLTPLSCSR